MDNGGLVALFGRRVDPGDEWPRTWAVTRAAGAWLAWTGAGLLDSGQRHESWREALAAVRAAEADRG